MSEEQTENDLSMWLSTYGLITVERLLERYKIKLSHDDLLNALKKPHTFYHQLLRLPLRNVFNGIIFQQARDYQVYGQKLYIDYLLSGESGKSDTSPGAQTRETLNAEREKLVAMGESFHQEELKQDKLIAQSQSMLIKHAANWNEALLRVAKEISDELRRNRINQSNEQIKQAVLSLLAHHDFDHPEPDAAYWQSVAAQLGLTLNTEIKAVFIEKIAQLNRFNRDTDEAAQAFSHRITEMSHTLKRYREEFKAAIIKANELLIQLPDYKINPVQTEINREELHFDASIGDQS